MRKSVYTPCPTTLQGLSGLPSSSSTKNHNASLHLSTCPASSCALASKLHASLSSQPSPLFVKLVSKKYARSLAAKRVCSATLGVDDDDAVVVVAVMLEVTDDGVTEAGSEGIFCV
jgi:hypothetical protein